jgi:hypothetical protein
VGDVVYASAPLWTPNASLVDPLLGAGERMPAAGEQLETTASRASHEPRAMNGED